jgi:hypothetical protein
MSLLLAAVVGRDETESPFSVEKLHCPARHVRSPLVRTIAILGRSEGDAWRCGFYPGSTAQNSKFVKYGAGGEEVRYWWGTGSVPLPN